MAGGVGVTAAAETLAGGCWLRTPTPDIILIVLVINSGFV